jgi:hypothetical protein
MLQRATSTKTANSYLSTYELNHLQAMRFGLFAVHPAQIAVQPCVVLSVLAAMPLLCFVVVCVHYLCGYVSLFD